jgi:hypothetical protein
MGQPEHISAVQEREDGAQSAANSTLSGSDDPYDSKAALHSHCCRLGNRRWALEVGSRPEMPNGKEHSYIRIYLDACTLTAIY